MNGYDIRRGQETGTNPSLSSFASSCELLADAINDAPWYILSPK